MKVTDLCDKGKTWSTYFPDKLCCPGFGCMATPFKAVTNILLPGEKRCTNKLLCYCHFHVKILNSSFHILRACLPTPYLPAGTHIIPCSNPFYTSRLRLHPTPPSPFLLARKLWYLWPGDARTGCWLHCQPNPTHIHSQSLYPSPPLHWPI